MEKHCATLKQNFIENGYEENILQDQIDKVDSISRKDLLRKNIKDRIPCLIIYNRELPMMRKIINKHWNVFEINPELQETFQSNGFVAFKKNKNLQEIIGGHAIKNGKVFQVHSKHRKRKCETQVNHHYLACKSLTPVHSEVSNHSNHIPYFTNSIVNTNSSFT